MTISTGLSACMRMAAGCQVAGGSRGIVCVLAVMQCVLQNIMPRHMTRNTIDLRAAQDSGQDRPRSRDNW